MTRTAKILVVDDEPNILKTIGIALDALGFSVHAFSKPQDAIEAVQQNDFDLAFVDLKMSPLNGMEVLAHIKRFKPSVTVVMITAHGSIDSAVEAVKLGAYHYIQKPFDLKELQLFTQKAWEYHLLKEEVNDLRTQLSGYGGTGEIITRNRATMEQIDLAARVAESNLSVLLEGESGTGKEVFAKFIHDRSQRADKPLVKINCAALPEQLLESELFGYARGAFTGAVKDRPGRFELANGGTMFLDEIAEIPPTTQVKLLRVLQTKEYERLGEDVTRTADVRVIAATNRNLDAALAEGTFRDDLYYRLNGIRIKLLPLRERPDDIPLLIQHFMGRYAPNQKLEFAPETMRALRGYRWPGNVRELEHTIERAVVLARDGMITMKDLPAELSKTEETANAALSLEEMERLHIKHVLEIARDYDHAAQLLGIDPATLWRKRKKFGL